MGDLNHDPKLLWLRNLRGHNLTSTQFMVLVTIAGYGDATGLGAHPGWSRLQQDTGLDRRTIKTAVSHLLEAGYLVKTAEGGNQFGRGRANEYALGSLTPAEGVHPVFPLTPAEGVHPVQGRGTSDVVEGVHPMYPHQINHQINHHPAASEAERQRQLAELRRRAATESGGVA